MNLKAWFLVLTIAFILSGQANAHDAFQKPLEKRYGLKTASCKVCHPINKDRSIHNKFGKLVEKQLAGKELTKKFNQAKKKSEEAVKEYEKEMVVHLSLIHI